MSDLSSLRPSDDSPAAIAAAITRSGIAEIDQLKAERVILLARGDQVGLDRNPSDPDLAAASVVAWRTTHGPIVLDGARVLFAASSAILAAFRAAPQPPPPSSAASFPPRPVA